MPNPQHAEMLGEGARAWNAWRRANLQTAPELADLNLSVGRRQFSPMQGGPIDLSQADLSRAVLDHATLIDADLTGAALTAADLSHARMMRADLSGADLTGARLDHADLKEARLDEAVLCGAQLMHARNLTQEQIDRARGDQETALPAGLTAPAEWRRSDKARRSQLARRITFKLDDPRADAYALLGVRRRASIHEVRAAYLKLVKELHPDGRALDPIASERLKAINEAYQYLKARERRAAERRAETGFFGRPATLFAVTFLVSSIAMSGVLGGLYYGGFFASDEPSHAETDAAKRPARAEASGEVTTGSIPLPPAKTSGNREATPVEQQPDPAAAAAARDAADNAAWIDAEREGTSVSLHRYLGRYPDGRHAAKATVDVKAVAATEVALDRTYDARDAAGVEAARRAMRRYLDAYPNGALAAEVRSKLKAIDAVEAALLADNTAWAEAERKGTKDALLRYLDAYPGGNNAAGARVAIAAIEAREEDSRRADHVAWTEAGREGTKDALQRYLRDHPDGNHVANALQAIAAVESVEARRQADRAAWAKAEQEGTKDALRRYLDAYPNGDNVAAAQQKLAALEAELQTAQSERTQDDADWFKARRRNTKESFTTYLTTHPNGRHARTAHGSIAALESRAAKAGPPVAEIKGPKQGLQGPARVAPDAPVSQRWQSADEPFVGADGRIRQR